MSFPLIHESTPYMTISTVSCNCIFRSALFIEIAEPGPWPRFYERYNYKVSVMQKGPEQLEPT